MYNNCDFYYQKEIQQKVLEPYELLMIIIIGSIAGANLFAVDELEPNWIVIPSIIILVGWFVYFGLWRFLAEEKKIETGTFLMMLGMFIGLTIVIMMAFNVIRIITLYTPDSL
jgi:predicted membrane channel-forming protein YqfA (hemolysin III family)